MLCLTRKLGEKIYIGDSICITIVEIGRGGRVRIGVEAPKDVPVFRDELVSEAQRLAFKSNNPEAHK